MSAEPERVVLPPYLSIRKDGDRIRLGTMPPLAHHVESAPSGMVQFLSGLSEPIDLAAAVSRWAAETGWTHHEALEAVRELVDLGALVEPMAGGDRYDRHRLYFHMLGVRGDPQARLAKARIGLIGLGGIGTQLATHFVAAGVGALIVTDGDHVELSNLTRQTLFAESDVGQPKVKAAEQRLRRLRADLEYEYLEERFDDPALARWVAARSDFVVLSADRPADVHRWANEACVTAGVPLSNAGYIESHGVVGPLIVPGVTPCFACIRAASERLPDGYRDEASVANSATELNPAFQTASYGPLNALVAAIQANEVLRHLLGLPIATANRRLLIDARDYQITWEEFETTDDCSVCGRKAPPRWGTVADQYADPERDEHSFNSLLLDDFIPSLVPPHSARVADVGAGAGHVSSRLLARGMRVDAFEPDPAMQTVLQQRLASAASEGRCRIIAAGLDAVKTLDDPYDAIVCVNVLDHVEAMDQAVADLARALRPAGTLVLSLPHPMKDRGGWSKRASGGAVTYDHFEADQYFLEGHCTKSREDRFGRIKNVAVTTFHRTIARYLNAVLAAGLVIVRADEPAPSELAAATDPVLYAKCSRIPYFFVVVARRPA